MASCVEQATESTISLKGSTKMVSDFFCKSGKYLDIDILFHRCSIYVLRDSLSNLSMTVTILEVVGSWPLGRVYGG